MSEELENTIVEEEPEKKRGRKKKEADAIKEELLTKHKKVDENLTTREFLSSGCTQLNLQCTGHPNKCYAKGTYTHIVGDSDSGKTWLAMTAFGEASINKSFDGYKFLYFDGENSNHLDVAGCFGNKAASRIERIFISSLEEFYDTLDDYHKTGIPYIAILDSMDALMPEGDEDKFQENKELRAQGKDTKGSFGAAKPKTNSALLRVASNRLAENGSILIIISQTRDNLGINAMFNPKSYSGGHALKFYSKLQIWVSSKGDIKRRVKGKDRQVGIYSKLHVKKNHIIGAKGAVDIPIYHNPGMMDDIGSCIEYLTEEGHWKVKAGKFEAPEFSFEGNEEDLARKIDEEGTEKDLRLLVGETWKGIQDACKLQRKNKYL